MDSRGACYPAAAGLGRARQAEGRATCKGTGMCRSPPHCQAQPLASVCPGTAPPSVSFPLRAPPPQPAGAPRGQVPGPPLPRAGFNPARVVGVLLGTAGCQGAWPRAGPLPLPLAPDTLPIFPRPPPSSAVTSALEPSDPPLHLCSPSCRLPEHTQTPYTVARERAYVKCPQTRGS